MQDEQIHVLAVLQHLLKYLGGNLAHFPIYSFSQHIVSTLFVSAFPTILPFCETDLTFLL